MTTYDDFLLLLKVELQKTLGDEFTVEQKRFIKNNGKKLDGIIISKEQDEVIPNIYVNDFFSSFQNGESIESIASNVIALYERYKPKDKGIPFDFPDDFAAIRYRLILRLINYEKNKELLKELVYLKLNDLAITFHYLVTNDETGISTIRIDHKQYCLWNKPLDELYQTALDNTKRLFPPVLKPIENVLESLTEEEYSPTDSTYTKSECGMYVLTNSKNINGASALLYPGLLSTVHEFLQQDFYILPSSIHEAIFVPVKENTTKEKQQLEAMVTEINRTQVAEEEILSNRVYLCKGKDFS